MGEKHPMICLIQSLTKLLVIRKCSMQYIKITIVKKLSYSQTSISKVFLQIFVVRCEDSMKRRLSKIN